MESKKCITWSTILCKKLIEATHSLWTQRNSFENDRQLHVLRGVKDIILKTAVKNIYGETYRYVGGVKRGKSRKSECTLN